jgi:hypothetical protein
MAEVEVMGCPAAPSPCDDVAAITINSSGPFLDTDEVQNLVASPLGGTWSGASTDGTFDPSIGVGTYSVTYTYDNGLGCVQSETVDIVVNTIGTGGCVLSNIALNGIATQSSTYGRGLASIAIDGNTMGTSAWSADLQHTNNENTPWWELDLGGEYSIDALNLFNRTDNLQSRLNNFYVFVSDTPFATGVSLDDLRNDSDVFEYFFANSAGLEETISLNAQGRYLRIQLSGSGILHMAEVEVMGCPVDNGATGLRAPVDPEIFDLAQDFIFRLVPNPASRIVTIQFMGISRLEEVIVYDLNGKQVLIKAFMEAETSKTFDITHLAKGVYQVYLKLADGTEHSKKLIKN